LARSRAIAAANVEVPLPALPAKTTTRPA